MAIEYPKLADQLVDGDIIDFGQVPPEVNALLQQGVAAYYDDRPTADGLFRQALTLAPDQLPVYLCLYKIHTYQRNLDDALQAARDGLAMAAAQAGLVGDWRHWTIRPSMAGPGRFALFTLKAMAFIHLRRGEPELARAILDKLASLGPDDGLGDSVIADIAAAL